MTAGVRSSIASTGGTRGDRPRPRGGTSPRSTDSRARARIGGTPRGHARPHTRRSTRPTGSRARARTGGTPSARQWPPRSTYRCPTVRRARASTGGTRGDRPRPRGGTRTVPIDRRARGSAAAPPGRRTAPHARRRRGKPYGVRGVQSALLVWRCGARAPTSVANPPPMHLPPCTDLRVRTWSTAGLHRKKVPHPKILFFSEDP